MTTYSWTTPVSGDWNTGTLWTSTPANTAPTNDILADVTIDAGPTLYTVTIGAAENEIINSLSMNDVAGRPGTNDPAAPYHAGQLELDGTLTFAPLSTGRLNGSLQTTIHTAFGQSGTIVNGGTIDAFIQSEGNLLFTGANGIYITNEIQALSGTVTIDTPIAEMTGTTLFDGIFEAKGPGSVMNLGGSTHTVDIVTMEGPQNNAPGWTELTFADPTAQINEWNGTSYVSVETTLSHISGGGTLDVTFGRNYTTANALTIDHAGASDGAGMLNMQGVTVSTAGITLTGGVIQGYGTIASGVVNNGTIIALGGAAHGTLDVAGALTGTGSVIFDHNLQQGTNNSTTGTLVVHSVSAGQTIAMNTGDTLELATPGAFLGTILATVGDHIILDGITATSAVFNNGTLVVSNGATQVASLLLGGSYAGDSFTTNGSTITIGTAGTVTPPGEVVLAGASSQYIVANAGGSLYIKDTVANRDGTQVLAGKSLMAFTDGTGVFDPTGTAEDVARLYQGVLNRAPDAAGLQAWTAVADGSGVPLVDIANAFTSSPEFLAHGTLSNSAFVNQIYLNALGRAAEPAGVQAWDDALAGGFTRGAVTVAIAESLEAKADTLATAGDNNNGEVYRLYETVFARAPDAQGQAAWASALGGGTSITDVAQAFIGSGEFQTHYGSLSTSDFVTALYQNALHRTPAPSENQAWVSALQAGASEADVIVGFSDSTESRAFTANATHANWVFIHS